ncbi:hypothetical protein ACEPAH_7842 [Sanghuangporus vaninii]
MEEQTHFALQVIRVHGAPSDAKDGGLYVEVKFAKSVRKTGILNDEGEPAWNDTVTFLRSDASTVFEVLVKKVRKVGRDDLIGQAEVNVDELLVNSGEDEFRDNSKTDSTTEIIGTVIEAADVIIEMVDTIAKIHPIFDVSWQATSALYKLVSQQLHTDNELIDLVDKMQMVFKFSTEARKLDDKTKMLKPIVKNLLGETAECSRFVQEYAKHGFLGRMARIGGGQKISDFSARFVDLRKELDSVIGLNTAEEVLDIKLQQQLETTVQSCRRPSFVRCKYVVSVNRRRDILSLLGGVQTG